MVSWESALLPQDRGYIAHVDDLGLRVSLVSGIVTTASLSVVSLTLLEGLLERVGVWDELDSSGGMQLSMKQKLTVRVAESDSKRLRGGLTLGVVGVNVPHPRSVGSNVGGELHIGGN